jgi:hypothetical protein
MVEKYRTNVCEIVKACAIQAELDSSEAFGSCTAGIYVYYSHSIQTTNNKQTIKSKLN